MQFSKNKTALLAASMLAGAIPAQANAQLETETQIVPVPAALAQHCTNAGCAIAMEPTQMLVAANRLIEAERYDEAAFVLESLQMSPELADQVNFLRGRVALATGDADTAISLYRGLLNAQPGRTRVRLELARALMATGRHSSADHHFRLAEQDDNLPDQVARMVRTVRGLIRDRRGWHLDVDIGLAPDTNINSATDTQQINVVAGNTVFPLDLADESRAQSGVGQTVGLAGGIEIGLLQNIGLAIDADTRFTNYNGNDFDDLTGTLAAGPEIRFNDRSRLTVQALASQRFYGWVDAQRTYGIRANFQRQLNRGARLAFAVDGRRLESGFGEQFSGWQAGVYGTYEQVLNRSFITSASVFGRRDALRSDGYSNFEIGGRIGMAGELPLGVNVGVSAGASRAMFDGPLLLFSDSPRQDWRLNGQITLGMRSIRVLGFSPSVTYGYSSTLSTIDLFDTNRHRVQFGLARYF